MVTLPLIVMGHGGLWNGTTFCIYMVDGTPTPRSVLIIRSEKFIEVFYQEKEGTAISYFILSANLWKFSVCGTYQSTTLYLTIYVANPSEWLKKVYRPCYV